ncbi:transcriptional regulator [Romboutsia weinsteinii]|uniref:Transcriptional regulator n=2 Tax=Romboutsia weinsteinii TaxID=2020949 RepID=A0A371J709_9FIRM|nr:helix-turn-helix domain-containing protein [Romboutsia weinsteinii]RDY28570.1 transcriptional regulator [Romboutsia weinsteinii]
MDKVMISHNKCHMNERCVKYRTCPMVLVHKLVSGKWKILILWYLSGGCLRFSEIKRKLPDVTQKMLTNQLRSLEEDGLINRKVYPVVPPKVEYSLSEMGEKMLPLLEQMYSYGIDYLSPKEKR